MHLEVSTDLVGAASGRTNFEINSKASPPLLAAPQHHEHGLEPSRQSIFWLRNERTELTDSPSPHELFSPSKKSLSPKRSKGFVTFADKTISVSLLCPVARVLTSYRELTNQLRLNPYPPIFPPSLLIDTDALRAGI